MVWVSTAALLLMNLFLFQDSTNAIIEEQATHLRHRDSSGVKKYQAGAYFFEKDFPSNKWEDVSGVIEEDHVKDRIEAVINAVETKIDLIIDEKSEYLKNQVTKILHDHNYSATKLTSPNQDQLNEDKIMTSIKNIQMDDMALNYLNEQIKEHSMLFISRVEDKIAKLLQTKSVDAAEINLTLEEYKVFLIDKGVVADTMNFIYRKQLSEFKEKISKSTPLQMMKLDDEEEKKIANTVKETRRDLKIAMDQNDQQNNRRLRTVKNVNM